jgi:hypothetical protein
MMAIFGWALGCGIDADFLLDWLRAKGPIASHRRSSGAMAARARQAEVCQRLSHCLWLAHPRKCSALTSRVRASRIPGGSTVMANLLAIFSRQACSRDHNTSEA